MLRYRVVLCRASASLAVDGDDNVWVANFGPLESGPPFTGRLTKLWGVNPPPGKNVGDPISPQTGFTVPSAGSEVLLHNGDPLYGPGEPPSFIPMMRQTSVLIDPGRWRRARPVG